MAPRRKVILVDAVSPIALPFNRVLMSWQAWMRCGVTSSCVHDNATISKGGRIQAEKRRFAQTALNQYV